MSDAPKNKITNSLPKLQFQKRNKKRQKKKKIKNNPAIPVQKLQKILLAWNTKRQNLSIKNNPKSYFKLQPRLYIERSLGIATIKTKNQNPALNNLLMAQSI